MSARWPVSPAAVALDALAPEDEALATRLLATDPGFRAEVERMRGTTARLGALGDVWEPEAPPALALPADTFDAPAAGRGAGVARLRRRPTRRVLAAAAGLAATVAVAVAVLDRGGDDGIPAPPATTLALRALPGAAGRAVLTLNGAGTEAELRVAGLRPSDADHYYEAWLADDRGRMVSMGTFRVNADGRADVHMPVAVDVSRYALVDVSLERDDGNPAHSNDSVLRGRL